MKRYFALFIAIMMVLTVPTNALAAEVSTRTEAAAEMVEEANEGLSVASDTYVMATYYDYEFYSSGDIKPISLEDFCVSITYRCTTETGSYDAMHLIITDLNGGGYDKVIDLEGDGVSHSMSLYLPAGDYKVQIVGSISHFHVAAAVNFYGYV